MLKFSFLKFCCFSLLLFPILLCAQSIQTVNKEITLNTDELKVAKSKALKEIAIELAQEMIGQERYQKEEQKINQFIISGKNRYILSSQISSPVLTETGAFKWTVKAKISRENLKQLLLEHNLFYESKGSSCLLPLVYFISYLNEGAEARYWLWWKQPKGQEKSNSLLPQAALVFFNLMEEKLIPKGFYSLNPIFQKIPEAFPFALNRRKKTLLKDFKPLAEFYTCDIALSGYVQLGGGDEVTGQTTFLTQEKESAKAALKNKQFGRVFLKLSNIKTGRFLFHLKRSFSFSGDLKKGLPKEASNQIADILNEMAGQLAFYQKNASLALRQMTLSVQGPLSYSQKEILKIALVKEVSGIKSLTERLLSSSRAVYLAEISEPVASIAKQLKKLKLPGFAIQLKGYKKGQAEIYVRQK